MTTQSTQSTAASEITTLDELQAYLHAAMRLEHATVPPYLTALYSMHNGSNSDAWHILRVVVVEEMLHLSLAANVLNAVGGTPDLTGADFVPAYPTCLPDGETDFTVDLQPFSPDAVATFLKIERPAQAPTAAARLVRRDRPQGQMLAASPSEPGFQYYSIGEFYAAIERGLRYLHEQYAAEGRELFTGDPARQVTPECFFSGGGAPVVVTGLDSAIEALSLIAGQGEGFGGGIYDAAGELAHYYRFEQLQRGRYYQKGDDPGHPKGPRFTLNYAAVYPALRNARLSDYPEGSEVRQAAVEFNRSYAGFLAFLTEAFTGQPELLLQAIPRMFRIRDDMSRLIRNPVPGRPDVHAAPTFEMNLLDERSGQ